MAVSQNIPSEVSPQEYGLVLASRMPARRPAMNLLSQDCNPTAVCLVSDYIEDSEIRGLSRSIVTHYGRVYRDFFQLTGRIPIAQLKPRDVRDYLAWKQDRGASDQTLRRDLCALRSIFRFAEALELISLSPARAIQTRRYRRKLPKPLTEANVNKLIEAGATLRDQALLETLYATGCRASEVTGMRVDDVAWGERQIRVLGKGQKERLVPLNAIAIRRVKAYLKRRRTGFLFQREGQPDQRGFVTTNNKTHWHGRWREHLPMGTDGRVRFRRAYATLGKITEMNREEAGQKLRTLLAGKLKSRPRPEQDERLTIRAVYDIVQKAAARAGIGRVHPHQLRHSFATHLLDHGAGLLEIRDMLGHVSVVTTQIYAHVSPAKMRETMTLHPHWSSEHED
jgi:site-specific recombinase XerD